MRFPGHRAAAGLARAVASRAHATAAAGGELDADVVVIGAGAVGLACAHALGRRGRGVLVLEAGPAIGTETSSRNSEVIHAGLYYARGSLKERTCLRGRELLLEFCREHGVPYSLVGKLLVATSEEQVPELRRMAASAAAIGVPLVPQTAAQLRELEPHLRGLEGLLSPNTGILDSHSFMAALEGLVTGPQGGMVATHARVAGGDVSGPVKRLRVHDTAQSGEVAELRCAGVVVAAGLWAQRVALELKGLDPAGVPPARYAKGSYFALSGARAPFSRLVYPLPEAGGLGVHLTLDLAGAARFGPDAEWLPPGTQPEQLDYAVDARAAPAFEAAVRAYWPGLPSGALQPAYSGVRPKVVGPGEPAGDFVVHGPTRTGAPGVVALYGIESPGLTASLALGELVADVLEQQG